MKKKGNKTLVKNSRPAARMETLTLNLLPKSCKVDNLEGQDYLVVPMVILMEGVHAGSMGPLFYPESELSKTPASWDHKPIVVYHPTMDGQGISACSKHVINKQKVGLMMNTRWEDGKLKSEAWIREDRADAVDERIMEAIRNSEMMELSTGVFVDEEHTSGKHNGEDYNGIARNYRPDHLALLPDQIGACSIQDGAGFIRNAAKENKIPRQVLQRALERLGVLGNALSHSDIYAALSALLRERFPGNQIGDSMSSVWVMDVFQNFVIFEDEGVLYRLGFTSNDSEVQLSEEDPVEVKAVREYRTITNAKTEDPDMNKQKLIAAILGNNASDADAKKLEKLPEEQLTALAEAKKVFPDMGLSAKTPASNEGKGTGKPASPEANPSTPPKSDSPVPAANAAKGGAPEAPLTVESYIASAPREIQSVLQNSLEIHNEEKNRLVSAITGNENNVFSKEDLDSRPLGELRKLSALMGTKKEDPANHAPNYSGQAPTPAANATKVEPLIMPAMNFDRVGAAKK